jgi:hypothetical protein
MKVVVWFVSLAGILSAVKLKYIRGLDWPGQSNLDPLSRTLKKRVDSHH